MTEAVDGAVTRSPGIKLLFAALIGAALVIPLMLVYALVYDRQDQSQTAQTAINAGWGGPQVIAGPVVVVPFRTTQTQNEEIDGKTMSRTVEVEKLLYISPTANRVATTIVRPRSGASRSIARCCTRPRSRARRRFALPADLPRFGVTARGAAVGPRRTAHGRVRRARADQGRHADCRRPAARGAAGQGPGARPAGRASSPSCRGTGEGDAGGRLRLRPARQPLAQPGAARRADPLGGVLGLGQPQLQRRLPAREAARSRQRASRPATRSTSSRWARRRSRPRIQGRR